MSHSSTVPHWACEWCGVAHLTPKCPRVKVIEYYENGTVKRVEFNADMPLVGPGPATFSATT